MKVSWSNGVGVDQKGDSDSKVTINVTNGVVLLDVSYDGSQFWTDVENGDANNKYKQVDQKYNDSSNYYGLSWKLTFTVDVSKSGNSNYDIFFDVNGSKAEDTTTDASENKTSNLTASAFRVFMGAGDSRIIWAPLNSAGDRGETDTNGVNKTGYVSGEKATTEYTSASTEKHGTICKEDNTGLKTKANDRGYGDAKHV